MTTELAQQSAALIKSQKWNSDAIGFVLTLNDNREICVQYEIQDNPINFSNGYPGDIFPIIERSACSDNADLSTDEHEMFLEYIKNNKEIQDKIANLKYEEGVIVEA